MSFRESIEIEDTITAIEEAKQELANAEYVVKYYPAIINELEKKLFGLLRTNNGGNGKC